MKLFRHCLILGLLVTTSGNSRALVLDGGIREISAILTDTTTGQTIDSGSDIEVISSGENYLESLSVSISGSQYDATVTMTPIGFFGLAGSSLIGGPHVLSTRVTVFESFTNDRQFPVDLTVNFLVVDGEFDLVGNTGSALSYRLKVGSFPFSEFVSKGTLTGDSNFFATFNETGDSLSPTQPSGPGGIVTIPFQLHTLNLGRLEAGEGFNYIYELDVTLTADVLEIARFEFRDPGSVSGIPNFSELSASPSPVPLPATFPLVLMGLAGLWRSVRRRHD